VRYRVAFGKKNLSLEIPDERVAGVLAPKSVRETADVGRAVSRSLSRPVASPPLAELLRGKRTALIITVDNTRPSPTAMLRPILDVCRRQGVQPSVMIATGRHRLMTPEEVRTHLGSDLVGQYRITQHDAFDRRRTVRKGTTSRGTAIRVNRAVFEHDVVIGCGIIEPSYLCGYSGGRKLLMPGLADHRSIDDNHYWLTHPDAKIGRLGGNPVSDDAAEFARDLPLHFIVYAVSGPNDEVVKIVSGHPVEAHERACSLCSKIFRVRLRQADVVISSAGGHPYDFDLVQAKKAIIPATEAVRRNGVIILFGACPDGLGAEPTFIDWLRNKTPAEVIRDVRDRRQFSLGAHGANILARPIVEKNARVVLVTSAEVARELKGTYVTALTKASDAWRLANLITGPESRVLLIEKARRLIVG